MPAPGRRKGRTALLICAAAVLGVIAGTCGGYLVQADREPTRLAPLSQTALARGTGDGPEPLPASRDRQVRTAGDLRELLVKKPAGTREADWLADDGWLDLAAYSDTFTEPAGAFENLVEQEFRRAAVTGWETDDGTVEVRLIQFRQEEYVAAAEAGDEAHYWAEQDDTDSWPIAGTGDGRAYVHNVPDSEMGVSLYSAEAHAWRGDIAMEIWIYSTEPIKKQTVTDLADRQMERL
ncbi:hypothetical protein AB0G32_00285 [Streptomyces sp. NPDC023723]|uniref:hypothetical protein n=1 Tax=Streptomyces sp. NPDC023723 TaxID=3154323 RepID=UPI00340A5CB2